MASRLARLNIRTFLRGQGTQLQVDLELVGSPLLDPVLFPEPDEIPVCQTRWLQLAMGRDSSLPNALVTTSYSLSPTRDALIL
jgi:hypothetical protein